MKAKRSGLRLVAKEAWAIENMHKGRDFHETFARVQFDALKLAVQFNMHMPVPRPEWNVSFLPTHIYQCFDVNYKFGEAWVLVEQELEGKFTKWNNNAGAVLHTGTASATGAGPSNLALVEEDEDEEEPIDLNEVPQAFSHFSYEFSKGKKLVCDLQGVWNPEDGFVLTDPVVHYVSSTGKKHKNGATDKGEQGVKRFFQTHVCGPLCHRMKLPTRTEDNLIPVGSHSSARDTNSEIRRSRGGQMHFELKPVHVSR